MSNNPKDSSATSTASSEWRNTELPFDVSGDIPATSGTGAPYNIQETLPDELLRHNISDEELGMLGDLRRDYVWEGLWATAGIALGALPGSLDALITTYWSGPQNAPMPLPDLAQVIIFFGGACVYGALVFVFRRRSSNATDMVQSIRDRTKRRA